MKYLKVFIVIVYFIWDTSHAETSAVFSMYSENKHFEVRYTSKLDPIAINQIHTWILHVQDAKGENVLNADITVNGGMPAHDHGLPTQPQITKNLGDGCYLLEGMKFHMQGYWTVTLFITHEGISDSVTFELNL